MAASKCPKMFGKKQHSGFVSLKRDNADIKKILVNLCHAHSKLYKLMESFLSTATTRHHTLPTAQEESVSQASSPDDATVTALQNNLKDALEKNKQWLEHDQEREAYLRVILDRMLWLKKQLEDKEPHNEEHSAEIISHSQEPYPSLQKVNDELTLLREQVDLAKENLIATQSWCEKKEKEIEELKHQLQTVRMSTEENYDVAEEDNAHLRDETEDLQNRLEKERRRSASFELQLSLFQRFVLNRQLVDQKQIEDLQRQVSELELLVSDVQILAQDLEDEKHNCSYLKKQMAEVLKTLQRKDMSKTEVEARCSYEMTHAEVSRDGVCSTPKKDVLSCLTCPNCQAEYSASHYQELLEHLKICMD